MSRPTVGSWLQLADPALTEMMAKAGFDWLAIDLEHTTTSIAQAGELIRIGDLAGVPMFVRLSSHDPAQIKRVLDAGAAGIIAPTVNTASEAAAVAAAAQYPPLGSRGVGLARAQGYGRSFESYRDGPAGEVIVIVQIESIEGVENLDDILSVDGVDGFFVGPYDLSGSLGHPGDFENPAVAEALTKIRSHIRPDGPPAGIHVVEPDLGRLREALETGYRFVGFASEMLIFSHRIEELADGLRGLR